MVSVGADQFWADSKPEDNVVPVKRRMPNNASMVSSMSSPQSNNVTRGTSTVDPAMQDAARRRLKKLQQDPNNQYS